MVLIVDKNKIIKRVVLLITPILLNLLLSSTILATDITKGLKNKLELLNIDTPYLNFALNLSEEEKSTLSQISVNKTDCYDNFGNLSSLKLETATFLKSLGNSEESALSVSNIVQKIVTDVLKALNAETAWVTIRAFTKNNLYDTPRWHTDGYYYTPFEGNQYKVAITLKGPKTLFLKVPLEIRKKFDKIQKNQTIDNLEVNRIKLAELLKIYINKTEANKYQKYQGTVFIVGSNTAAVHSEPSINSERLFISILPASKNQINELKKRWKVD